MEAGEVDELEHTLLANEGKGKVGGQVILANKGANVGHYDCEQAETPLVGGVDAVLVRERKGNAVLCNVG